MELYDNFLPTRMLYIAPWSIQTVITNPVRLNESCTIHFHYFIFFFLSDPHDSVFGLLVGIRTIYIVWRVPLRHPCAGFHLQRAHVCFVSLTCFVLCTFICCLSFRLLLSNLFFSPQRMRYQAAPIRALQPCRRGCE